MRVDRTSEIANIIPRPAAIHIEQEYDSLRDAESWVFSTAGGPMSPELRAVLTGANIALHDYFGFHPFFIVPIPNRLRGGEVFRNLFLLRPFKTVPFAQEVSHFCTNHIFMRKCLEREVSVDVSPIDSEIQPLHTVDAIQHLFNKNFHEQLSNLEKTRGLMCFGVVGTDAVHYLRGLPHEQ